MANRSQTPLLPAASHAEPLVAADQGAARSIATQLDSALVRGIAWTAGVKWAVQVLTWGSTFVVARLLSPSDYGIMSLAILVIYLINLLAEFGIGTSVVALRHLSEDQLAQVNTLSIIFGAVAFATASLLAWPAGRFFDSPELPAVIVLLSGGFLVSSFRVVPWALLQRELRFKRLAIFDGAQSAFLAFSAIVLAYLGCRYWTLAITNVLGAMLSTAVVVWLHPHRFARPRRGDLGDVLRFNRDVLLSRIAYYAYSQSHFLVAGKVLGKVPLGAYSLGWSLASTPGEKTNETVMRVTPSIFSAAKNDPALMARYFLVLTEVISSLVYPAILGLVLVAPQFVHAVLGDQWAAMIVPLQILGLYACFRIFHPLFMQILHMTGDTQFESRNTLLAASILTPCFWFASRWGLAGLALTWVVVHPLIELRVWRRVFRRFDISLSSYFRALWPALSSSVVMVVAVVSLGTILPVAMSPLPGLAARVGVGAVAYLATFALLHRGRVAELRDFMAHARRS